MDVIYSGVAPSSINPAVWGGDDGRYAERSEPGDAIVRVPADESAGLADVMELAAEVESLKKR